MPGRWWGTGGNRRRDPLLQGAELQADAAVPVVGMNGAVGYLGDGQQQREMDNQRDDEESAVASCEHKMTITPQGECP